MTAANPGANGAKALEGSNLHLEREVRAVDHEDARVVETKLRGSFNQSR